MRQRPFAIVLGTRPEIIKLGPLIRFFERRQRNYFVVHTGQHYSYEMDRVFFKDLGLLYPKYQLSLRSSVGLHGDHTGRMMVEIEKILMKERPSAVFVQGDTNTVLAGSLAVAKLSGILLGHVEAGLRSYDRRMPEEVNRVVSDHASDLLFAPTPLAKRILLSEGIPAGKIFVTGNTIVDAVIQNLLIARKKRRAATGPFQKGRYLLMTMHRPENVDKKDVLTRILKGVRLVARSLEKPVLFSIHPRTEKRFREFGLKAPEGVHFMRPVGFLEFVRLEADADLILTDSGGVQEEACILRVPCVTLRTTTERPETVEAGANIVAGHEPNEILRAARTMIRKKGRWRNPFGDGRASQRIAAISERHV